MPKCERCGKIVRRNKNCARNRVRTYLLVWKYNKATEELSAEVERSDRMDGRAVFTHIDCGSAPEIPGTTDRIKKKLRLPSDAEHPLLMENDDADFHLSQVQRVQPD